MNPRSALGAAAATLAVVGVYATLVEPRWLRVERRTLHVRSLPPALEGLRIGLLTDLHAGPTTPQGVIRRAVDALLEEAPDLVAVTGDLVDRDAELLPRMADLLAELRPPLGLYTVPGNHDHVVGIAAWRSALGRHRQLRDITNASVLLHRAGARLCVAGLDDDREGHPALHLPPAGARDFTILLAHSPDQAERLRRAEDRVDLVLSGHTHGGQVRLPGLKAPINSASRDDLYEAGVRRRPWTQVYTSRGVGNAGLPLRFFTRPEVSVLTLTAAPRRRLHHARVSGGGRWLRPRLSAGA
ncbi:MAG: metallophosphoesterase [Gemmatimonadota bacterium]